jgi:hypothetical protein
MSNKPWQNDIEIWKWYEAAADEVLEQALANPDIPIPVDPDVAEFMGAYEDPTIPESEFWPDPEYLAWVKEYEKQELEEYRKNKK